MKFFLVLTLAVTVYGASVEKRKVPEADALAAYDLDGDGIITPDELLTELQNLGIQANYDKAVAAIENDDTNGDGGVDKDEFDVIYQALKHADSINEGDAFSAYDQDGDGSITFDEIKTLINEVLQFGGSDDDFNLLLNNADTNGDGGVDLDEFDVIYQTVAGDR